MTSFLSLGCCVLLLPSSRQCTSRCSEEIGLSSKDALRLKLPPRNQHQFFLWGRKMGLSDWDLAQPSRLAVCMICASCVYFMSTLYEFCPLFVHSFLSGWFWMMCMNKILLESIKGDIFQLTACQIVNFNMIFNAVY